jgi:hypothetical protein
MDWFKGFDLDRWWKVAIVVGLALVLAALAANNRAVVLVGLGIVACGFGEWINHRMQMEFIHGGTLTSYHRANRPLGLVLDALGTAVAGAGIYLLVMA